MLATQIPQMVHQLQAEANPIRMIRTGDRSDQRNKECMQTCIACSTEETVACLLEWQAAPADAASSSPKEDNSSEARSPLMLILRVFGNRSSEDVGPFTFTMSCSSGTRKVGFANITFNRQGFALAEIQDFCKAPRNSAEVAAQY